MRSEISSLSSPSSSHPRRRRGAGGRFVVASLLDEERKHYLSSCVYVHPLEEESYIYRKGRLLYICTVEELCCDLRCFFFLLKIGFL